MLTVYGLSYWMGSYVELSIRSIKNFASEEIEIIVVNNPSPEDSNIIERCDKLLTEGKIDKFIQMEKNVRGNALRTVYEMFPPKEDYFVFTDLDVLVSFDWIKSLDDALERHNIAGFRLSEENYTNTPNHGFTQEGIGSWLMGIDREKYEALPKDVAYTDHYLRNAISPCKQIDQYLYHLGFNIWRDCPEYWEKHKTVAQPWGQLEMSGATFVLEK